MEKFLHKNCHTIFKLPLNDKNVQDTAIDIEAEVKAEIEAEIGDGNLM